MSDEGKSPKEAKKRWPRIVLAVVVGLLVVTGLALRQPTKVASGYSAKRLCSEVFVAGRQLEDIVREDLALMPLPLSTHVDRDKKEASVSVLWATQTAAWRPGLGCALTTGVDLKALKAAGFEPTAAPKDLDQAPWPAGDKLPEALPEGVDRAKMDAAMDWAFEEPDPDVLRLTRAVVVLYKGQIVAERYAKGYDRHTPLLGWSMTKSVTSALMGVLAKEGKVDIKAPAPVPQWSGDDRAKITTDALLRMSSGLGFDETYGPFGDVTAMLFTKPDTAGFALQSKAAAEPDKVWSYSSGTTNILSWIIRQTLGDDAAYHRFARRALFEPIGAWSAVMETDPSGTMVGSSFLYMNARDWARFGLLYLNDGVWQGNRILPEGWVKYSCTPTGPAPQGEYGAQWWLNAGAPGNPQDRMYPSLPTDVCAAQGFETQRVMVIPSRDVVIVRLGLTQKRGAFDVDAFGAKILDALPKAAAAAP